MRDQSTLAANKPFMPVLFGGLLPGAPLGLFIYFHRKKLEIESRLRTVDGRLRILIEDLEWYICLPFH